MTWETVLILIVISLIVIFLVEFVLKRIFKAILRSDSDITEHEAQYNNPQEKMNGKS
jgi:uncharacterized protein HemY